MRFDDELATATRLAQQAADLLLGYHRKELQVDRKDRGEPVTEADRAAERLILDGLRTAFPDDGLLSEEQRDRRSWRDAPRAWVIDPLDGTKDFIAGRVGFSVMIGLLERFRPVLGVVCQPLAGLTYRGADGSAEVLHADGRREALQPTTTAAPESLRLVVTCSHRSAALDEVARLLGTDDELSIGSVGVKVGLIARGERDLYVNPEGHCRLWDVCAPQAILTAAGGRLTDLHGAPIDYDRSDDLNVRPGIIASNGACHDAVLERLAPLFAGL